MIVNLNGEWIGFVLSNQEVYSVYGEYVGYMTKDPRILRKRSYDFTKKRITPLKNPGKLPVPGTIPLAPLMADLSFEIIDILMDEPDKMPTLDSGEFRKDLE
jgi:hypothetical protein